MRSCAGDRLAVFSRARRQRSPAVGPTRGPLRRQGACDGLGSIWVKDGPGAQGRSVRSASPASRSAFQRSGSSSSIRRGRVGADSIQHIAEVSLRVDLQLLHVVHRLIRTAAVWPPLSLPANNQFLRPSATGLNARSQAPLSSSRNPASRGTLQRHPMVQRILNRFADRALGQEPLATSASSQAWNFVKDRPRSLGSHLMPQRDESLVIWCPLAFSLRVRRHRAV